MNQARSPLGEVIGRALIRQRGIDAVVMSAGTMVRQPMPAAEGSVAAAARLGLDLEHHVSQPVTAELTRWADVVLTMERRHVIDIVTDHGGRIEATYTLPELAAYAGYSDPAKPGEAVQAWLDRIAQFRRPADLLGGPAAPPEVSDPIGRSRRQFRRTAHEIQELMSTIVSALFDGSAAR